MGVDSSASQELRRFCVAFRQFTGRTLFKPTSFVKMAGVTSRATEIERRADELRADLERANLVADQARTSLAEAQNTARAAAAERDQVRTELVKVQAVAEAAEQAHQEQRKTIAAEALRQAERLTATQGERDQAREEAATLRGRLEALASHPRSKT
ncbi:hypothetical protein [Acidovorax sp. SUPP2539]|uniref:hypothetical protein n=1 Tax=Acidovorax sp. SUPP2539 TaxID=2920878 RepID=UPI0023DE5F06|nr:hypothetical protein [Acidovorax sp. SUPP2539]GKS92587.1 hypothetical protein AVTE2539_24500 [Acidovorax sp. SUPP2539]